MNTRLTDEVREAFRTASDVEIPPIDRAAFRARIAPARRRRTIRRVSWGAVAVGGAAACVLGAVVVAGPGSDDAELAPAGQDYLVEQTPTPDALLVGDGELVTVGVDTTSTYDGSFGPPKDAYRTPQGVLVLGEDGRLTMLSRQGDTFDDEEVAGDFDAFQVSTDGTILAGFPVGSEQSMAKIDIEGGGQVDAPLSADRRLVAAQGDEVIAAAGDALQHTYVIESPGGVATETATFDGIDASQYGVDGSWRGDLLALPRKDDARTDVYRIADATADKVSSVPLASGVISPAGDSIVGFTHDALRQEPGVGTADAIALWSTDGERSAAFSELPALVVEFSWLDNDTVAVLGGDGEGQWPTALDLYTCELTDMTCSVAATDPTGPHDELPILASGTELPTSVTY